ncbi:MAG: GYF domain-containing protein [Kofleriaceae bacterium]
MKIVCDSCQAKYSISDDKVQGKVFKIRCKKCSNIIVVRGGAGAAEPAAQPAVEKDTRVYDYGYDGGDQAPSSDESVWHVVINQDQVGPMTATEVQQRFAAGEIDGESYIWREGFADWLPLAQVDVFAAFVASGTTTAAVDGDGGGAAAVSSMFGGGLGGEEAGTVRSDPGDLFAAASSGGRHAEDDGDLFGSKPAAAASSSRRQSAGEAAAAKLRGERNENSVLFSLNNLAQLASDKPAPVTAAPSSAGHATGAAGGEGSGLIDIRSMANAYRGGPGGAAKPATSSAIGSIDDLPVFGGGGFSEPAVMVPTARPAGNSKLMYVLIGSVGLLAVAAVILVVVMLKGGDDKGKPQVAAAPTEEKKSEPEKKDEPKAAAADPVESKAGSATPTAPAGGSEPVAAAEPKAEEPKEEPKPDTKVADAKSDKTDKKSSSSSRTKTTAPVVAKNDPKPAPAAKEPASGGGGGCDEVACVVSGYEGACCQKYRKGKPAGGGGSPVQIGERPKSDVPDSLDRGMVSDGVGKVKARVIACGSKSSAKGVVRVSVKVTPDGNVASVTVKDTPDAGLGSCVAAAMQKATFKKTANGGSFAYPWTF